MSSADSPAFSRELLDPPACRLIEPSLAASRNPDVWVYRYTHYERGWTLSIATHAEPGSGKLSLGGFRIAPVERTNLAGYSGDREAISLAIGMEEKVHWSRVIRAGGPLAREHGARIVGGKCVLTPTPDARVGQPNDFALLDFALACFADFESVSAVRLNTGQDLGHGLLSDNTTTSLEYLSARFHGCVSADTSRPTAEGNFHLLRGMLDAFDIPLASSRVLLVGCGNIGQWVLRRLMDDGAAIVAVESRRETRERLRKELGIDIRSPEDKLAALAEPLDAVVVNANGASLDAEACRAIAANERTVVVCGSENLAMPDRSCAELLRAAGKVYAPTEFGGMMGYLTAVEQYLSRDAGVPFTMQRMLDAARVLEQAGRRVTQHVRVSGHARTFEQAVGEVYADAAKVA